MVFGSLSSELAPLIFRKRCFHFQKESNLLLNKLARSFSRAFSGCQRRLTGVGMGCWHAECWSFVHGSSVKRGTVASGRGCCFLVAKSAALTGGTTALEDERISFFPIDRGLLPATIFTQTVCRHLSCIFARSAGVCLVGGKRQVPGWCSRRPQREQKNHRRLAPPLPPRHLIEGHCTKPVKDIS